MAAHRPRFKLRMPTKHQNGMHNVWTFPIPNPNPQRSTLARHSQRNLLSSALQPHHTTPPKRSIPLLHVCTRNDSLSARDKTQTEISVLDQSSLRKQWNPEIKRGGECVGMTPPFHFFTAPMVGVLTEKTSRVSAVSAQTAWMCNHEAPLFAGEKVVSPCHRRYPVNLRLFWALR